MAGQNEARNLARVMASVYNWLSEFQDKGEGNWLVFFTASQGDFVFAGHGDLPKLRNDFYVECVLKATLYNGVSLRFYVDDSFGEIIKVGLQVGWKDPTGGKIDQNIVLAKKLGYEANRKQEETRWFWEKQKDPHGDVKNALYRWLDDNARIFQELPAECLLSAEEVSQHNRKFLEKLKTRNFVVRNEDGQLSVPDNVLFPEQGEVDSQETMPPQQSPRSCLDVRQEEIRKLLESSHQVILTGAPGTGKTYLAKKVALAMLGEQYTDKDWDKAFKEGRVGFCQFHPSYDYSDFVEGLRPIQGTDGQVGFKRMDGVFKKMCKDAISASRSGGVDNFDESWKKFVTDLTERNSQDNPLEIKTDSTMFKVFLNSRNNLSLITSGTDNVQGTLTKARIREYYIAKPDRDYWACYYNGVREHLIGNYGLKPYQQGHEMGTDECPKFVFIIDEINRGDISKIFGELFFSIDPGYRGKNGLVKTQYQNLVEQDDEFEKGFYVPENVYILGTMNDIDRSVESMDFAIRRRFVWKEVPANSDVLDSEDARAKIPDEKIRKDAKSRMEALNKEVVKELGSEYAIGPAYFLKMPNLDNDFKKLWTMNLEPLLREYLRGNSKGDITAKMNQFSKAYFSESEIQKNDDNLNAMEQGGNDASGVSQV